MTYINVVMPCFLAAAVSPHRRKSFYARIKNFLKRVFGFFLSVKVALKFACLWTKNSTVITIHLKR